MITDVIFEDRLSELVDKLPPLVDAKGNSFVINFDWGTSEILNKYIANNNDVYPLVWLIPTKVKEYSRTKTVSANCRIVILNIANNVNEFNRTIYNTEFKNVLNPIKVNLINSLKRSSASFIGFDREIERIPNFSIKKDDKGATIAIVNAITIDAEISFNNNCLKEFNL